MKFYIAAPFDTEEKKLAAEAIETSLYLKDLSNEVYCPWRHKIEHAWDYPNAEWGLMVFENDISAIQEADWVIVLSYGRESTAGTNWEAGYAFGIGKRILVVEMTDNIMSLMVANGRYATVKGLLGFNQYDFNKEIKSRTNTEQK